MIKIKVLVILTLLAAINVVISACSCGGVAPTSGLQISTIAQVVAAVEGTSANTVIVDVNPDSVRDKHGMIPGAIKLSDYNSYTSSELPSEKSTQLIFYCYNQSCGASAQAAKRAQEFGYINVSVFKEGIIGWNVQTPNR